MLTKGPDLLAWSLNDRTIHCRTRMLGAALLTAASIAPAYAQHANTAAVLTIAASEATSFRLVRKQPSGVVRRVHEGKMGRGCGTAFSVMADRGGAERGRSARVRRRIANSTSVMR